MIQTSRYCVKYGMYGAYFYDEHENRDLTLIEVMNLLNGVPLDTIVEQYRIKQNEDQTYYETDFKAIQAINTGGKP